MDDPKVMLVPATRWGGEHALSEFLRFDGITIIGVIKSSGSVRKRDRCPVSVEFAVLSKAIGSRVGGDCVS